MMIKHKLILKMQAQLMILEHFKFKTVLLYHNKIDWCKLKKKTLNICL